MTLHSTNAHAFPYYQATRKVELGSSLTEFDDDILEIVSVHQPIMAKHIASQLSLKHKFIYSRRDINSRLFKTLFNYLIQDEYFRWSLRDQGMENPGQDEDPEKEQYTADWDVVNLDSTTRIKYANGKEITLKFTKLNSSRSKGPQADITYVYYESPLAMALLTRKVGDVCYLPGGRCEVLEID